MFSELIFVEKRASEKLFYGSRVERDSIIPRSHHRNPVAESRNAVISRDQPDITMLVTLPVISVNFCQSTEFPESAETADECSYRQGFELFQ